MLTNLTEKELDFIRSFSRDFLEGYTVNGKIKLDKDDPDPDELLSELQICQSLISKLN
jgi:hypothetical protein